MNRIKEYIQEHSWALWTTKVLAFPFWLIYKVVTFIMNFSKIILNTCLILLLLVAIAGGILYSKFEPMYEQASEEAYEKLSNLSADNFHMLSNTVIYDKDGKKIGEIDSGSYHYVKIKNISEYIQNGYIATEDKRFKSHAGIDLQSLTRAAVSLWRNNGEITQGGSTITQQVIKNNLLTQEQSYSRKLTEVLLAPTLEKKFNKAEIMEFYCNSNYYGNQCYGVETASQYYFGCSAKDVTLAQAAMLCGISNSPNNYNPIASMDLATEKKEQVLGNMLEQGYITEKEYKAALKEKIKVVGVDDTASSENYMVSYAIDCATLQLMEQEGFEFKYTFDTAADQKEYKAKYSKVYSEKAAEIRAGGYKLYTSFDQKLQKKLQKAVSNTLSTFTEKDKKTKKYALQSAAMCIDNETQYVVAVVGGRTKKDEYNRAFLSTRQPGSTIKPLLDYGPAIDNNVINASTIINDSKVYWDDTDKKSYSPKNSGGGYHGRVTAREGLARSLNTVAFQVFKMTGIETSLSYLDKLKFTSLSYADNSAPAISLGGFTNGVTINDMCRGYATLENNGQLSSRTCLTKIEHETNGTVYEAPEKEESESEVYSADTSFIMKDMLQGTFAESYGTGHSAYNDNQIYAGKTGTTSSNKDAWFCGFSAYYTTAVWIGYDTPREMSGMYGGTYPLKIWSTFMNDIHSKLEKKNFEIPSSLQLRKISDGKLTDSVKEISYDDSKRYYSQRPSGYDYYSTLNEERNSEWEVNYKLEDAKKAAEAAVTEFEEYKVESVKTAINFEKKYNRVLAIIEEIPDEYEQADYKKRAVKKYNSLNEEVMSNWQEAISEYQADAQDKREKQEKVDAEDSNNKAQDTLKKNRIKKLQWYIDTLNGRSYYTDITKLLIKDGKKALKKVKGYSEYESMEADWNSAVSRAKALPAAPETPEVGSSSSDNKDIDESKYEENETSATATPEPTATVEPTAVPQ
jgi:penicillin-binding protein 1A